MRRTRASLMYAAGYLLTGGVALLFAPQRILDLLQSDGDYGDVMPRLAGMLLLGLGMLMIPIIRHGVERLYPAVTAMTVFFCACLLILFFIEEDPLFLAMMAITGLGAVLTGIGWFLDHKGRAVTAAPTGGE